MALAAHPSFAHRHHHGAPAHHGHLWHQAPRRDLALRASFLYQTDTLQRWAATSQDLPAHILDYTEDGPKA